MNEDIWALPAPDETITLGIVEPLHLALHQFPPLQRTVLVQSGSSR